MVRPFDLGNLIKVIFGLDSEHTKAAPATNEALPKAAEQPTKHPSHLADYLNYYRSLSEPHYAVLVTGDWGTGKTFQVRESIPNDQAFYVSLFGLNSTEDVVAAVYAAMFPGKAFVKRIASSIGETTAEISGIGSLALNGITSGLVGALLRQQVSKEKPIIFDDLERCGLDVKQALGVINLYVEHHGCRVIVIAHDNKLTDEFSEAKEKIFGQTIRVDPRVEDAFDKFHSSLLAGPEKNFIAVQRGNIIGVFSESGIQSLRILRHVVEDLARLGKTLSEQHLANDPAMVELVRLFCALNIELRAGHLKAADLYKRKEKEFSYELGRNSENERANEQPRIVSANNKYTSVDITSTLLQDHALNEMLVEGRFDKETIQASLNASSYFIKSQSAPWQIVGSFDKLDDEIVASGLAKMEQQFDKREVSDSGEILHIFSLRMMMANKGISSKDIETVTQECIEYIDDLLSSGRLPPRGPDWDWYDDFGDSAYGVSYWVTDDYRDKFQSVFDHLLRARGKALEAEFPKRIPELLKILETDGQLFLEKICYTHKGNPEYGSIPILAAVDPKTFVAAWMRSPKQNWYWVSRALQERYKGSRVEDVLKPEAAWINAVVKLLDEEAAKATGLAKLRIHRTIPKIRQRQAESA
ncbi:hypothetical protein [Mesorhizobium sp. J8]|uniref:hypothetical protein n=1 Tax=Mesorhizobium sp. J8 TaxID=2777475 RepID=UPI00191696D8|nr:hypothetical protein [Mesorhizobium sp. J8]BCM18627.1 hypothetical protein MJ8_23990 [Mesorhizobium sp. J8]